MIRYGKFGVFRCINNRLPAGKRKIFGKLQPPLYARTSTGWPIVGDDEHTFIHVLIIVMQLCLLVTPDMSYAFVFTSLRNDRKMAIAPSSKIIEDAANAIRSPFA